VANQPVVGDEHARDRTEQAAVAAQPDVDIDVRVGQQPPGLNQDADDAGDQATGPEADQLGARLEKSSDGLTVWAAPFTLSVATSRLRAAKVGRSSPAAGTCGCQDPPGLAGRGKLRRFGRAAGRSPRRRAGTG
jgi:hypothetical protein